MHANPALHLLVRERLDTLLRLFSLLSRVGTSCSHLGVIQPSGEAFETWRGNFFGCHQNASSTLNGKHWFLQPFKPSAFLCVICIRDIPCCQQGNCGARSSVHISAQPLGTVGCWSYLYDPEGYRCSVLISCLGAKSFLSFLFFYFFLMFERETDRTRLGEGQRERKTQNLKQALGSELLAQSLMQGSNP